MDAIEMLEGEHRDIEELLSRYSATEPGAERREIVRILGRNLTKHAALEEEMLYPLMARLAPNADLRIERRLDTHAGIRRTLVALTEPPAVNQAVTDRLMDDLQRQVREHAQSDETDLLPRLRNVIDQQACDELGEVLVAARKIAPEQVQIRSPIDGPSLALTIPIATFCDRLSDRLSGA